MIDRSSAAHAWSRRSNFPDFGHESEYALFGLAGKPLKLGEWRAIIGHARAPPLPAALDRRGIEQRKARTFCVPT
jgi:hypothetical protein